MPTAYFLGLRMGFLTQRRSILILSLVSLGYFCFDIIRLYTNPNNFVNRFFRQHFGFILRQKEKKTFSGALFFGLGLAASVTFFSPPFTILSLFCLLFGDGFASLIGKTFGTVKILGKKSLQGSLACFIACFLSMLISLTWWWGAPFLSSLLLSSCAAFVATSAELIAELHSFWLNDNLLIPLSSATVLSWLDHYFQLQTEHYFALVVGRSKYHWW